MLAIMEEPVPERSFPLPSPQPTRELLEGSWGLDLTPEREMKPRERLRKSKKKVKINDEGTLSTPQLNSTAVLCSKIKQLKLQATQPRYILEHPPPAAGKKLPTQQLSAVKENIEDLEDVLNQRPITEVNIPRHTNRYSNLVSVELTDESFERLVTKPCKKKTKVPAKSTTSEQLTEGPSVMDFFCPELEWEKAEWNVDTNSYSTIVDSLEIPHNHSSSLYKCIHPT